MIASIHRTADKEFSRKFAKASNDQATANKNEVSRTRQAPAGGIMVTVERGTYKRVGGKQGVSASGAVGDLFAGKPGRC